MKDSWRSREYRSGDESGILALYREVNGHDMDPAHRQWKFAEGPFGPAVSRLMFDGDNLIGYYAIIPMEVLVASRTVRAALSVNTMTHPEYGRQGIFTRLAAEVYEQCRGEGFRFVYGFPNENSYHGFITGLGWQDLGRMTVLQKNLTESSAEKGDAAILPVDRFDSEVTGLWEKARPQYDVAVTRTEDYLNWRFTRHPAVPYAKYVCREGGGLTGYMVLKTFAGEGAPKGHIVDMQCLNAGTARRLVGFAERHFAEKGVGTLSCFAPDGSLFARALTAAGCTRQDFPVNFGLRILDAADKSLGAVARMPGWYLTMGDLDVF